MICFPLFSFKYVFFLLRIDHTWIVKNIDSLLNIRKYTFVLCSYFQLYEVQHLFGIILFWNRNFSCHYMHNQMYSLNIPEGMGGMITFIIFVVTCAVISLCQTTLKPPNYYLFLFRCLQIQYQFYNYVLHVCRGLIVLIQQVGAFKRALFYDMLRCNVLRHMTTIHAESRPL